MFVTLPWEPGRHDGKQEADALRNGAVDEAVVEADLTGIKVLVVDDEEDSVAAVKRILKRRGAEVRGAGSMDEALGEFRQFAPHVVLSDIGMP